MLFTCVICAELINQSADVHSTPCGHLFHYACLCQWLERSTTCPQCRNKCTLKSLRRIYFNIANIDANEVDIGTLQQQLDASILRINALDKELKDTKEQYEKLKTINRTSLKSLVKAEGKVEKYELLMNSYSEMINVLKSENKAFKEQAKEIKELKEKMELMSSMKAILEGSLIDVDKILKDEKNPKNLAVWITTLRRELRQSESKKNDIRKSLKLIQNDLRKLQEEKSQVQEKVLSLESENYTLQEKIALLENNKANEGNSFTNKSPDNVVMLDNDYKESPTKLKKVRKIQSSNSPYFNIKSSSVGIFVLEKFKDRNDSVENQEQIGIGKRAAVKKSSSDLSEKYTILKRSRLETVTNSTKLHNSSRAFNGFGYSEKR